MLENAFISVLGWAFLVIKKQQSVTLLPSRVHLTCLSLLLSGMGVTQGNDGERVILIGGFYLQGKSHREKITPYFRRSTAGGIVPVGSFLLTGLCGFSFFSISACIFIPCFQSFAVFLAGDVVPLTGDEQRFLLGKVRCNSCVLGAVIPSTVPNCPS